MADDDVASAVRSKLKKVGQAAAVAKRNWPTVGEQQQAAAAKVKRYWPGKAPAWAEEPDEHYDLREALNDRDEQSYERPIVDVDDARIRRLQDSRRDREEAVARHRQIRAAEIVSTENEERGEEEKRQEEEEGEEDDDAIEERRRRIRERLLQKQKEEELPEEDEEEEVRDCTMHTCGVSVNVLRGETCMWCMRKCGGGPYNNHCSRDRRWLFRPLLLYDLMSGNNIRKSGILERVRSTVNDNTFTAI